MADVAELDRYRTASRLLFEVARHLRVLRALDWPGELREQFLAGGATRLPAPTYTPIEPTTALEGVAAARRLLRPGSVVDDWLEDQARAVENTALMLSGVGTPAFHAYSRLLYGVPTEPLRFDPTTPLELAEQIQTNIRDLTDLALLKPRPRDRTAEEVAATLQIGVKEHFGEHAPRVELVDELSANAVAAGTTIKVRRDARFTSKDAEQLLNHEAFIHVGTSLNGRAQDHLPILAVGHPGTTRAQEGLAVFSEFVSGTLELDRLSRLADRTTAVQMVCDGADFIELFRWFSERTPTPEQAFESTRRIFRGSPVTGGYPFTKDSVYISGFLRVLTFVRAAFAAERADTLSLLFAGKLDLFAIPALGELRSLGLLNPPVFVPPWARDPGWVLTFLTLSTFIARIDLAEVAVAVGDMLERCPVVEIDIPDPE